MIVIRKAVIEDAEFLAQFNIAMAFETEDKRLVPEVVLDGVKNLIRFPERGFYFVAEDEGQVVGCLMITKEWSDWRNAEFWWVQSVYVPPEFRKQGIYKSLYLKAKEAAAEQGGICGIRLYVERDNERAKAVYERLGMKDAHYLVYEELFEK